MVTIIELLAEEWLSLLAVIIAIYAYWISRYRVRVIEFQNLMSDISRLKDALEKCVRDRIILKREIDDRRKEIDYLSKG